MKRDWIREFVDNKDNFMRDIPMHECVCHIYEMGDQELIAFYKEMDEGYKDPTGKRYETYEHDKREVEAELLRRNLAKVKAEGKVPNKDDNEEKVIKTLMEAPEDPKDKEFDKAFQPKADKEITPGEEEQPNPELTDEPEEEEEPAEIDFDKIYIGHTDDVHYYLVVDRSEEAEVTDLQLVNQEGDPVYSAKEHDLDPTNVETFIDKVIQEVDIAQLERSVVLQYILPEDEEEEEIEPEEEEPEEFMGGEEEEEELPAPEPTEPAKPKTKPMESKDGDMKKKLSETLIKDEKGNEFDIELLDETEKRIKLRINDKEYRFTADFAHLFGANEGRMTDEGIKELALETISHLDEQDYVELVAQRTVESKNESKVQETVVLISVDEEAFNEDPTLDKIMREKLGFHFMSTGAGSTEYVVEEKLSEVKQKIRNNVIPGIQKLIHYEVRNDLDMSDFNESKVNEFGEDFAPASQEEGNKYFATQLVTHLMKMKSKGMLEPEEEELLKKAQEAAGMSEETMEGKVPNKDDNEEKVIKTLMEEEGIDYRGKRVRFTGEKMHGHDEPLPRWAKNYVGKVGIATSIRKDNEDEGVYFVKFDDGRELNLADDEIELAESNIQEEDYGVIKHVYEVTFVVDGVEKKMRVEAFDEDDAKQMMARKKGVEKVTKIVKIGESKKNEGYESPGKRDGTGPYKASARRKAGLPGMRKSEDEECVKEDHKDILSGGLADNRAEDEFDPEQLQMGIKVELEHTNTPELAKEIAMDHLAEDPQYYTHLDRMEKGACDEPGDRTHEEEIDEPTEECVKEETVEEANYHIPDSPDAKAGDVEAIAAAVQQIVNRRLVKSARQTDAGFELKGVKDIKAVNALLPKGVSLMRESKINEMKENRKAGNHKTHLKEAYKPEEVVATTFEPGVYYFGDICYVMKDEMYHGFWGDKCDFNDGVYDSPEGKFAVAGTAYGDGEYKGSDGIRYGVDAGVLGIVPESMWKVDRKEAESMGRVFDVQNNLRFEAENGEFSVNTDGRRVVVNTRDGDEEEGEDEEEYYANIDNEEAEYEEDECKMKESETVEEAKKDPKAEVRNRGNVVFPAGSKSVKDDKDHFPINNIGQARNALARVNQYSSAPKWYTGSLDTMKKKVASAVHAKYPSIKISKAAKESKVDESKVEEVVTAPVVEESDESVQIANLILGLNKTKPVDVEIKENDTVQVMLSRNFYPVIEEGVVRKVEKDRILIESKEIPNSNRQWFATDMHRFIVIS